MSHPVRRTVRRAAIATGAVLAGRSLIRRRRAMDPVPPELRSPVMWIPISFGSDRTLRLMRALQGRAPVLPPADGVEVDSRELDRRDGGRIRVLVHQPEGRDRPSGALLWIHGGGLIFGIPEQSNEVASRLAKDLGIVVAVVDYRLAPEDPYPAGLDDCMDALAWLHDQADALGLDPSRIAVGGDSAGGGLAAAVCQRALDEGGPAVAFQALVYPMLDDRTALRSDDEGRGVFVWTAKSNAYAWQAYLGHIPGVDDPRPYVAPARRDDLAGLPPAWLGIGELDLFYEEDLEYARRLEAAGVPCQLHVVAGMYHGADGFAARAPAMVEFHASLAAALRVAIGGERAAVG
jgi:acetyl esterase/lipase